MNRIKAIKAKGTPHQIGYIHGAEGKAQIHQSLETYERLFSQFKNISWDDAINLARNHLEAIEKYEKNFIEEMQGVANGSGTTFDDILVLNTRSEIALTRMNQSTTFSDGCTAIGVYPPIGTKAIIGQNWDWKAEQRNSLLLLDIEQEGKPNIKMVTEGGLIGKVGCNSRGIGVCLNALHTDCLETKVPLHLGLRAILNSSTLAEAISKVSHQQLASPANFLLGSDEGNGRAQAMNIEVSPKGIDILFNPEGYVVHTNHLLSREMKKSVRDLNEFKYEDSYIRKNRAEQLIRVALQKEESISAEHFQKWLTDDFNAPNSIQHFSNSHVPAHRQMETVFSIIMDLSEKRIYVSSGNSSEMEEYVI
ncbi:C45 family autoproteolytic acyltransferase/hydolase [Halalkalibacter alkaliphilus]|uniref:C45 family peptidase n=1 Tax=Halalkalibacter alkaliphilus TaxID=2917993 RepID=A0A9X2CWJ7_9BACI|nr:C45 family peptidase [Halalkalibacter alkaliphilus]